MYHYMLRYGNIYIYLLLCIFQLIHIYIHTYYYYYIYVFDIYIHIFDSYNIQKYIDGLEIQRLIYLQSSTLCSIFCSIYNPYPP